MHKFQLMKSLGFFPCVLFGMEGILLAVQVVSLLTFMKKEYTLYGISIAMDFALLFLVMLFYLFLSELIMG